jgi:hypothetical protein
MAEFGLQVFGPNGETYLDQHTQTMRLVWKSEVIPRGASGTYTIVDPDLAEACRDCLVICFDAGEAGEGDHVPKVWRDPNDYHIYHIEAIPPITMGWMDSIALLGTAAILYFIAIST